MSGWMPMARSSFPSAAWAWCELARGGVWGRGEVDVQAVLAPTSMRIWRIASGTAALDIARCAHLHDRDVEALGGGDAVRSRR
jgi:hypothetical protein